MRIVASVALMLCLAACAAGPGHGGEPGALMGAQARQKHGADPVAAPPPGVGEAEDPAPAPATGPTPRF